MAKADRWAQDPAAAAAASRGPATKHSINHFNVYGSKRCMFEACANGIALAFAH